MRKGGSHGLALVYSQQRRAELFLSTANGAIECLDTGEFVGWERRINVCCPVLGSMGWMGLTLSFSLRR